jgi:hypothetical protein
MEILIVIMLWMILGSLLRREPPPWKKDKDKT